ncbi:sulfotransferase [Stenotrophomonas terrae]|uniref:tetratricopeptide repeat-containing sulfotransferase family protein n=1 Tax=Stenotrophomonas terrae TaxID=405446 RepID=UPI00320966A1
MRRLLERAPDFAPAMEVLGMALAGQARVQEARTWFCRAAALQPDSLSTWMNLGNACLESVDAAAAGVAFERAHALGADDVAWLLGYGLALLGQARFADANRYLGAALSREPDAIDVRLAYAQSLAELERFEELALCLEAVHAGSLRLDERQALAWLLAQAGNDDGAQQLYRQVIAESPESAESRVQFALLLERLNRVEEADQQLRAVPAEYARSSGGMFELAAARVLRRQHQQPLAILRLGDGLQRDLAPAMQAQLQFELARNHDQLRQAEPAMLALAAAHDAAGRAFQQRLSGAAAPPVLDWLQQRLLRPAPQAWAQAQADPALPRDPIFLVGFPRSGTTLLERILDAHTDLDVLDERPALEVAIAQLRASPGWQDDDFGAALDALTPAAKAAANQRYWDEVRRHLLPRGRLVDKYPLTMTRLPYVARLFPQAQWLLLLRHPCDCVLSCHMQAFGSNGGAMAFTSLDASARTYVAIMEWWEQQRTLVPAHVHVLRYEDMVADLPGQLSALMAFLSQPMQEQQLAFAEHASTRSRRINTPSYSQVVQPLNAGAVGRWRSYRAHFSPQTLALLAPWVQRYGYTLD